MRKEKRKHNSLLGHQQAGFTVVELVVTIGLLSFGVIGIYSAFATIATLHTAISYRFTAAYLAQEGIEVVRNIRDYNFTASIPFETDISVCSVGCQLDFKTATPAALSPNQLQVDTGAALNLDADGLYSYDSGAATPFRRTVTVTQETADKIKVSSLVTWEFKGTPLSYVVYGYLYNWH